jgi:hypothetical protein
VEPKRIVEAGYDAISEHYSTGDLAGWHEDDWLGAPNYFSHVDAATNLALVRETGFEIEFGEPVIQLEDGAQVAFGGSSGASRRRW